MSDTIEDDGPRLIAAEYVLGTLDATEAAQAEAQCRTDPAFATEISFWENRLYPLTELVPPVPPPATLWSRIEDATGAQASAAQTSFTHVPAAANSNDRTLRRWRAATFASLAVAASLLAFIVLRPVPAPVFAVLAPTGDTATLLLAVYTTDGSVLVRPNGALQVAPGKDLELWSLPAGATRPSSLGVLPAAGKRLTTGLAVGSKILVSLEPKGGSPTGQPTGPVVYGGTLQGIE